MYVRVYAYVIVRIYIYVYEWEWAHQLLRRTPILIDIRLSNRFPHTHTWIHITVNYLHNELFLEAIMLYSHIIIMLIYTYMLNGSQRHNDKGRAKTSLEKYISHFICNVWKGLLKVCVWERVGDRTELQYIDPHSYGHQRCVFLVL